MSTRDKHNKIGFETPEGYFDRLADRMIKKSWKAADQIDSAGFQVPDGYFEKLNDRVMQNVQSSGLDQDKLPAEKDAKVVQLITIDHSRSSEQSEKVGKKSIGNLLYEYALPIIGTAAAIVALITINGGEGSPQDASLDSDALSTYVYNLDDYLDPETVDILYDDAIVLDDIDASLDIDDAALMDYLVSEMDMNQILSE
ncbi:hypothetical protein BST97_15385 [Nonlabens spongiae]|uniref:Uncharacterized protein n=1 Tax=Nonlabens spongiae TaxID=331648 RepID=A0A1W6MNS7_9FLAO|nr:hypothetical protein [Nonlabens spongiae]ARN79258.1 hypothetical protein BST97_15385 [Nonlabens spongiae]